MATNDASPSKGNGENMNQSQTTDDTDTPAARAECFIDVQQKPMGCAISHDEDRQGRADVGVEVWGETTHSEARVYIHGAGDLPAGGDYRVGFAMPYIQAVRLRDRLDDALQKFE